MMLSPVLLALVQAPVASSASAIPPIEEVREQIIAKDARLFWAAFEGCAPSELESILTEDYRMLHDVAGLAVPDRASFIAGLEEQCASRAEGGANEGYKNRRLLTPGSRTITRLGEWGVLERGYHNFFEWRGDEVGWVLTGGGYYVHTWKWIPEEAQFRLLETLSLDHGAALPYPPQEPE